MARSLGAAAALVAALLSSTASASLFPHQTASPHVARAPIPTTPPALVGRQAAATGLPTAVSECHMHGATQWCEFGTTEYEMVLAATATTNLPSSYTDCHTHGATLACVAPDGSDVVVKNGVPTTTAAATGAADSHSEDEHAAESGDASGGNCHCHYHAGVEHCTNDAGQTCSLTGSTDTCEKQTRDYNIPLRVGLLFVIMATSAIGVFLPIVMLRWRPRRLHKAFLVLKQFGTGIIISTAFVHLYTHASLMFGNECLREALEKSGEKLEYEATTSAIVMAGIFLSFLVEFIGKRIVLARVARSPTSPSRLSPELVSVLVLEMGIIFHSILIGLTLVVAGDNFFITLFVVIIFHQMFEGIALGTRIAGLGTATPAEASSPDLGAPTEDSAKSTGSNTPATVSPGSADSIGSSLKGPGFSFVKKLLLASPFAFVTPIGMAIGIGVLQSFNGNDRSTIIAIGTLDALSAGILVWVGVVEMWAEDWMMEGAELLTTGIFTTLLAGLGLVSGMVLMSVLGKWA